MRLRIMEFNAQDLFLQLAYPINRNLIDELTEDQWQFYAPDGVRLKALAKVKAIAQIIQDESPDLVCLCEVGGLESLQTFADVFLDKTYKALLVPGNSDRGIESGFLLKSHLGLKAHIKSHRHWPVPFFYPHEKDPEAFPNEVLAAAYAHLGKPEERKLSRDIPLLLLGSLKKPVLAVLLVHLKSGFDPEGFDLAGRVRRAAEYRALLEIAKSLPKNLPLLVTGDFNARASRQEADPEFSAIYQETDWEDALELAAVPHHERYTHVSFVARNLLAKQLDYMFLSGPLKSRLVPEETHVYRYRFADSDGEIMVPVSFRERAQIPSDHYPMFTTLDLGPKSK